MALEQELQDAEVKAWVKEEEEIKNPDDLTDEEIEAVKELIEMAGWKVLEKCMEKRIKKQEDDILVLAKEHFMEPKKMWYTAFEVLWGFVQWMKEMERLVKVLTADPEEVQKAVDALNELEKQQAEGKWK